MLERLAEPGNAIEDYCLHFDASGAIGIPYSFDPQVNIDIFAILVDVGIARYIALWEVKVIRCRPHPVLRQRFSPSRDEEVDGYGVFEYIVHFLFVFGGFGEVQSGFGARAEVGDIDCGRGETGGVVLGEAFEHGTQGIRASFEGSPFFYSMLDLFRLSQESVSGGGILTS